MDMPVCPRGQGGGLKIHCRQLRVGSNPTADNVSLHLFHEFVLFALCICLFLEQPIHFASVAVLHIFLSLSAPTWGLNKLRSMKGKIKLGYLIVADAFGVELLGEIRYD